MLMLDPCETVLRLGESIAKAVALRFDTSPQTAFLRELLPIGVTRPEGPTHRM